LGPGPTLLARAVLPDPSFWSADLPAIYDVTVSLMRGETVIGSARRELGLRWLGIRSDHFVQAGKRWVMRGVSARSSMAELPREWHEAGAAYVSAQLELDCLSETSEWGALAAVEVSGGPAEIMERLREISKFPGAGMAIVRGELPFDFKRSQVAPNLLLAQAVRVEEMVLPPWAQFLWAEFDDEAVLSRLLSANAPVVAVRYLTGPRPLDQARAACDQLQRDLAGIGQFAGYVV